MSGRPGRNRQTGDASGRRTLSVLVNPTAGRGRGAAALRGVQAALLAELPTADVRIARAEDYTAARALARTIVADAGPGDALVVIGGDGMMGLGIDAVAGTDVPLGLIPAGTGNDICRGLDIPTDPRAAARLVARAAPRKMDAIKVSGAGPDTTWVGSIVASGFDARVNRRANRIGLPIGSLRYAAATLAELATFRPLRYRLIIDGHPRELTAMLVAVANTRCYGGGMRIAPDADPYDGLLDVTIIHPVGPLLLLRLLPAIYRGTFVSDPCVERLRASTVELAGDGLYPMGDGEELAGVPLSLIAAPGVAYVYAP